MTDPYNFDDMRERLAVAVETYSVPTPEPLDINPWLAMSLLQKAIRRGRDDLAQRAAATLLRDTTRDRLWRRLGVIAVEDVGLGDLATVELVTVALAGKRVRAQLGGEWPMGSYLVSRLSQAAKCRAADDLVMLAHRHPAYIQARLELAYHSRRELVGIVSGKCSLVHRAIALMYLLGTDRGHEGHLVRRRGRPGASAEALSRAGCSLRLIALAEELHRKTHEPLGPLVALLSRERGWESRITVDDSLPPEVMIGSVPGWAYDMFTRDGRTAYSRFLRGKTKTARWISTHVAPAARLDLLSNLVFYLEGGQLDQRLRWPVGDDLHRRAEIECLGEGCPDSTEVLGLLRADFAALNRSRRESIGGSTP